MMNAYEISGLADLPPAAAELVAPIIRRELFDRIDGFLKEPGKGFRSRLVETGFLLSGGAETPFAKEKIQQVAGLVEHIHSASLILDDIQDGSLLRRGQKCLYLEAGVPLALNCGTWLLFSTLGRLSQIDGDNRELLREIMVEMITRAHLGQAVDLSTKITQVHRSKVREICHGSMALKTGTIVALALECGAILAGANLKFRERLRKGGQHLGVALQMFDDLGSLSERSEKRFEDLLLERPGQVFAYVASCSEISDDEYKIFLSTVRSLKENPAPFLDWLRRHEVLEGALREAREELDRGLTLLEDHHLLRDLSEKIASSYHW